MALTQCAEKGVGAVISAQALRKWARRAQAQLEIADLVRSAGMRDGPQLHGYGELCGNTGVSSIFGEDLLLVVSASCRKVVPLAACLTCWRGSRAVAQSR